MRKNIKFGVLSDEYIKNNYANCFLPISVDKLHSIRQKPASSYINTSGKRIKEYNSIAPVIPQFVAENNTKSKGIPGQNEMNAIKSDLIRTSANAESNYSILQPPRKREGLLQEDIGFVKISSMANAQDPNFGPIDKDFVGDELEEQAPLSSYGVKAGLNYILGYEAPRHKEDMVFAGRGAKPGMAKILDPSVASKLFLAEELKRQPESALFVKRQTAQQQGAPSDLLAQQQGRPDTMSSMGPKSGPALISSGEGVFADEEGIPAPLVPTGQPVETEPPAVIGRGKVIGSDQPLSTIKNQILQYADEENARILISMREIPDDKTSIPILLDFLATNLRTGDNPTKQDMEKFLGTLSIKELQKIRKKYFKKIPGPIPGSIGIRGRKSGARYA